MRFDIKSWLLQNRGKATLLGVCPICKEIVRATLQEAAEWNFIPMFVVTPRQVDADRGYTGWSQEEFMEYVMSTAKELGYVGSFLIARDHGGPYQSNRDRGRPEVSLEDAMNYAKEMFIRDVKSGFHILHVDATEDPRVGTLEVEEIARRTVELIAYIEDVRVKENLPNVYYEVGTEEISGGITKPEKFQRFIQLLKDQFKNVGCEQAIKYLLFIVGQVGTTMRIDMHNTFNPQQAKTLVEIASKHGLFLKVHYTDWLETPILEQFPKLGISAANVGPEFGAAIIEALAELEKEQTRFLREKDAMPSRIMEIIEEETIKRAPWKRFVPKKLRGKELEKFARTHSREIAVCLGRYVINDPKVVEARQKLYENLRKYGIDPHQFIINKVRKAIRRYILAFGLSTGV